MHYMTAHLIQQGHYCLCYHAQLIEEEIEVPKSDSFQPKLKDIFYRKRTWPQLLQAQPMKLSIASYNVIMIKTTWSPLPKLDGTTWQRLHLPSVKSLRKLSQQYFSFLKIIPAYSRCYSRFFHCALICASLHFVLFLTDLLIVPGPSRCCFLCLLSLLMIFNIASLTQNRVT